MSSDRWARWLLEDRFGGDEDAVSRSVEMLAPIRDRVLLGANVKRGDVVLDVGCGDGLIGFEAVLRAGETGQVMFADISDDLLDRCRQIAKDIGVSDRCRFIATPAESLDGIDNASVDVVATRSVLIFVADKAAAFAAFHRVLRPGGRISLFEPINRRYIALNRDLIFGFESAPIADLSAADNSVTGARSKRNSVTRARVPGANDQISQGPGVSDRITRGQRLPNIRLTMTSDGHAFRLEGPFRLNRLTAQADESP